MTSALDRLSGLQGQDRNVIITRSAWSEWEKTDLFMTKQGREGTAELVEIVLPQCGNSEVDMATPLLAEVLKLKTIQEGSEPEKQALINLRQMVAKALMTNNVPYEFGGGDGNAEDAANAHDSKMQGQQKLPALKKFKGQETTRESFLAHFVQVKAKGQMGEATVQTDDENAAPVDRKVAV